MQIPIDVRLRLHLAIRIEPGKKQSDRSMNVCEFNPLTDPRWSEFVAEDAGSSIFHTREWLEVLRRTYGYQPTAFTISGGSRLTNGVLFSRVSSWLTGKRLVSLPFSDHCQPLAKGEDLAEMLSFLKETRIKRGLKYLEVRPATDIAIEANVAGLAKSEMFTLHTIDIAPDAQVIYDKFHESCIRRKIRKAEREALIVESGRSERLMKMFRHLLLLTRRRHRLPPQPAAWFDNIVNCLGEMVTVYVASKDGIPIASILVLAHKKKLVYKYGCSDGEFSNLGGTPLVFWKAIQQAKDVGMEEFDLGRSNPEESGLIAFKEHLGAVRTEIQYYRDPWPRAREGQTKPGFNSAAFVRDALVRLPDPLFSGVGELLYKHIG
jgi:CelD/BcsL family acetyltransferase involved in cellulose biosynthesis